MLEAAIIVAHFLTNGRHPSLTKIIVCTLLAAEGRKQRFSSTFPKRILAPHRLCGSTENSISGHPWNSMRAFVLLASLLALSTTTATAADTWSKPITDLRGRLVAEPRKVKGKPVVELWIDLENTGPLRRSVVAHDPFSFSLTVKDAGGKALDSDSQRLEILSSPQVAVLPRECVLRLPVTMTQEETWNLDITTHLWKLKPGHYKLAGKYSVPPGEQTEIPKEEVVHAWSGELQLPEIEIEIK
jgi:hypothetical protein